MFDEGDWNDPSDDDADGGRTTDQKLTDKEVTAEIDKLLEKFRPERYNANELGWLDAPIEEVVKLLSRRLTAKQILQDVATKRVRSRESGASGRINAILRDIVVTGQFPLSWGEPNWSELFPDIAHLPLSIPKRQRGLVVGRIRVQFAAMTSADWLEWENGMRRSAEEKLRAVNQAADGGALIREMIGEQEVARTDQVVFNPPSNTEPGA